MEQLGSKVGLVVQANCYHKLENILENTTLRELNWVMARTYHYNWPGMSREMTIFKFSNGLWTQMPTEVQQYINKWAWLTRLNQRISSSEGRAILMSNVVDYWQYVNIICPINVQFFQRKPKICVWNLIFKCNQLI